MGSVALKPNGKRHNLLKQPARQINKFAKVAVLATGLSIAATLGNAQSVTNPPLNSNQGIEYISQKDTTAFGLLYPWLYAQSQEKQGHAVELVFLTGVKIQLSENPKEKLRIRTDKLHLVLSIKDQLQLKTEASLEKDGYYLVYYRSCTSYVDAKSFYDRLDIYQIKPK